MIDVDRLSEKVDYELIPSPENEQSWNIRVLSGPYVETIIQFGAISIDGKNESINYNFDIIETPDDTLSVDDPNFQQFTGLVLTSVIEDAINKDELIMKDREEKGTEE